MPPRRWFAWSIDSAGMNGLTNRAHEDDTLTANGSRTILKLTTKPIRNNVKPTTDTAAYQ
jgi:hypothetical protein